MFCHLVKELDTQNLKIFFGAELGYAHVFGPCGHFGSNSRQRLEIFIF